jgi:hypothetical protein
VKVLKPGEEPTDFIPETISETILLPDETIEEATPPADERWEADKAEWEDERSEEDGPGPCPPKPTGQAPY